MWAFVDADTPLDGAAVRVVAQDRRLRQMDGSTEQSTNENGITTLAFENLPRSFTVVVSGGRAEGRRVVGALRTAVDDYEPGRIVYINPATTLAAELLEREPGSTENDAIREAKRILGIPRWHNITVDLERSDGWFGGDDFLERSHWRIGRTIERLAAHPDAREHYRGTGDAGAAVPQVNPVTALLGNAAYQLLQDQVQSLQATVLSKVLAAVGLPEDLLDGSDAKEIRRRFDEIGRPMPRGACNSLDIIYNRPAY